MGPAGGGGPGARRGDRSASRCRAARGLTRPGGWRRAALRRGLGSCTPICTIAHRTRPRPGPAPGRITPEQVRVWHHDLTVQVSENQAAKAYRLLRAVLHTAADDGHIGAQPVPIPGGGQERSPERPFVTPETALALVKGSSPATAPSCCWPRPVACASASCWHCVAATSTSKTAPSASTSSCATPRRHPAPHRAEDRRPGAESWPSRRSPSTPCRDHLDRHAEPGPDGLVFCNHRGGPLRRATLKRVAPGPCRGRCRQRHPARPPPRQRHPRRPGRRDDPRAHGPARALLTAGSPALPARAPAPDVTARGWQRGSDALFARPRRWARDGT